jgi:hypothetical protein
MIEKEKGSDDFALLTRKQRDWLLGKIQVSKAMQRDFRYRIRKKIEILQNQELPLLVDNGFFESNKQGHSNQYIATANTCSVVTNHDGVVSNHDDGWWSSLVKISPQTWQEIEGNQTQLSESNTEINGKTAKWAGSDLNQRTPPCQGDILTKLDHRPLSSLFEFSH